MAATTNTTSMKPWLPTPPGPPRPIGRPTGTGTKAAGIKPPVVLLITETGHNYYNSLRPALRASLATETSVFVQCVPALKFHP